MARSLKETLLANLHDVPCFEILFDEKTGLTNDSLLQWQAQQIVNVHFPDNERMKVVNH